MLEEQLGPPGAGLPEIPDPSKWDESCGIDEAAAIAVTPYRALIFWELATIISANRHHDNEFVLTRLRLDGDNTHREQSYPINAIGRFQDSDVKPGLEYLYVISMASSGEETPILVTNPIRLPLTRIPGGIPYELPSSIDLANPIIRKALSEGR